MVIKVTGVLEFEPENKTRKHEDQASWKRVAMIHTHDDLHLYYAWFVKQRFGLDFIKPLRCAHVTIINDRGSDAPKFDLAKSVFHGKSIDFFLEIEPRTNGEHWWLRVHCPDGETIREVCGLKPNPFFPFHMTLGNVNDKYRAHSEYIMQCCKNFYPDSCEPRKPLNKHEIIEFVNNL